MKLFREIKEGQTWTSINESGVWKHIVAETNPDILAWEQITSMNYLDSHFVPTTNRNYLITSNYIVDYIELKDIIRSISEEKGGWNYLDTEEKYLIIKYYIYRTLKAEKISFLMSQGMSQQEAGLYCAKAWFRHNKYGSFIDAIMQRWKFSHFYLMTMCDSDTVELELERQDIAHSVHLMEKYGIVGTYCNDVNRLGLMDYFNSTGLYLGNGFYEGGIQPYAGITKEMVIAKVNDIMVNGNYDPTMCNQ